MIDVEKEIKPPPYVHNNTLYDLSQTIAEFSITKDEEREKINEYDLVAKVARCAEVQILHDDLWPEKEYFGLDNYQMEAFKAALTKQFVVIQGPPGLYNLHL